MVIKEVVLSSLESWRPSLWEIFPYFDKDTHYFEFFHDGRPAPRGGVRKRIFNDSSFLYKIPLIKYLPNKRLLASAHLISNVNLSKISGLLLHFKFDFLFAEKARQEVKRGEHWEDAKEYKLYVNKIEEDEKFCLYSSEHSVKFRGSQQLVDMKFMKTSSEFDIYKSKLLESK